MLFEFEMKTGHGSYSFYTIDVIIFNLLSLFWKKLKGGLWYHFSVYDPPLTSRNSGARIDGVVRQRLGKDVPAAMNTHATLEELLEAVFSVLSV
jgi:hypothetical protein